MNLDRLKELHARLAFTEPKREEGGYPAEFFADSAGFDKLCDVYQIGAEEMLRRSKAMPVVYFHMRRDPETREVGDGLYEMHMLSSPVPFGMVCRAFQVVARLYATLGESRGTALLMQIDAILEDPKDGTKFDAAAALVHLQTPAHRSSFAAPAHLCDDHVLHIGEFTRVPVERERDGIMTPLPDRDVARVLSSLSELLRHRN